LKKLLFFIIVFSSNIAVNAQNLSVEVVRQAFANIEQNYYDTTYHSIENWDTTKKEAFVAAINGELPQTIINNVFTSINDPALRCLTPKAFNGFYKEAMSPTSIGIGLPELFSVDIDEATKEVVVITPMFGSPAFKAGILPKDIIRKINGEEVKGKQLHEVTALMRGKLGDIINIKIERNNGFQNFTLEIEKLEMPLNPFSRTIKYKRQRTGVIWIPQFSAGCSMRVLQILDEMKKKGIENIVLDLRHNPGGLVNEAQAVAGLFIGQKPMAFSQAKNSAIKMFASTTTQRCELPITVLVNSGTASVAEALAGVLQYYDRATVFGQQTNGKGLIYSFFTLNDLSTLVIPVGRMQMLDGRDILTNGVEPDVVFDNNQPFALHAKYKDDELLFYVIKQLRLSK
jgi:carboxyl-terminal processing protease